MMLGGGASQRNVFLLSLAAFLRSRQQLRSGSRLDSSDLRRQLMPPFPFHSPRRTPPQAHVERLCLHPGPGERHRRRRGRVGGSVDDGDLHSGRGGHAPRLCVLAPHGKFSFFSPSRCSDSRLTPPGWYILSFRSIRRGEKRTREGEYCA